jgi:hypothetical protein
MIAGERQMALALFIRELSTMSGPLFVRVEAGSLSPSVENRWRRPSEGWRAWQNFQGTQGLSSEAVVRQNQSRPFYAARAA